VTPERATCPDCGQTVETSYRAPGIRVYSRHAINCEIHRICSGSLQLVLGGDSLQPEKSEQVQPGPADVPAWRCSSCKALVKPTEIDGKTCAYPHGPAGILARCSGSWLEAVPCMIQATPVDPVPAVPGVYQCERCRQRVDVVRHWGRSPVSVSHAATGGGSGVMGRCAGSGLEARLVQVPVEITAGTDAPPVAVYPALFPDAEQRAEIARGLLEAMDVEPAPVEHECSTKTTDEPEIRGLSQFERDALTALSTGGRILAEFQQEPTPRVTVAHRCGSCARLVTVDQAGHADWHAPAEGSQTSNCIGSGAKASPVLAEYMRQNPEPGKI
jgi:hypothetical protein